MLAVAGSMSASRTAWNGVRSRAYAGKRPQALGLIPHDPLPGPLQPSHVILEQGPNRRLGARTRS
jgi:hypothetical protein